MKLFDVSTDSTCDLKKEYAQAKGIWVAPLKFVMEKDGQLQDGIDDFSCEEEYVGFYKQLEEGGFSRTSMLTYEKHLEHFEKIVKAGAKVILHLSLSSGLSPMVGVAKKAAAQISADYPDVQILCLDTKTATAGQGLMTKLACECRDNGMTAQQAYEYLEEVSQRIQHCIVPDDLMYLKRGGRISSLSAAVGTMLNVKPLIAFDTAGKLQTVAKCRGMKMVRSKIFEMMDRAPMDDRKCVIVVHTNNYEGAQELADLIEERYGVKPDVTIMGPVIGSHVGPGSVSCGWISVTTRNGLNGN